MFSYFGVFCSLIDQNKREREIVTFHFKNSPVAWQYLESKTTQSIQEETASWG